MKPLFESRLDGVKLLHRGKVRDVYDAGENRLLIVATDRLSAFDVVLPTPIPDKGRVLTQLSLFWFDLLSKVVPNHLITACVDEYPEELKRFRDQLEGRSMLVHKAKMAPVECVARGYLSGSGWKDYKATGALCGIKLPAGLRESDRLPEPIFTPSTKAEVGHDENISFEAAVAAVGAETAAQLKELTLKVYSTAAGYALTKGIILADTKFEFGYVNGTMVLADEVLTPDSSRFWPADQYQPGGPQPSFDKQYVRDWLEAMKWNKQPPAPELPADVAARTTAKYREAYERLVGKPLP
jgi:phosphoribosylaminoimidazole-succinocarboxamide synthase